MTKEMWAYMIGAFGLVTAAIIKGVFDWRMKKADLLTAGHKSERDELEDLRDDLRKTREELRIANALVDTWRASYWKLKEDEIAAAAILARAQLPTPPLVADLGNKPNIL